MDKKSPSPASVDAYIQGFPDDVRQKMQAIRSTILQTVPEATEKISYQMPLSLIARITAYRAEDNRQKERERRKQ